MEFYQTSTFVFLFIISMSTLATQVNLHEIKKLLEDMKWLLGEMKDKMEDKMEDDL